MTDHVENEEKTMLPDKQKRRFEAFYGSARRNDVLEPKVTLMIHIATSMAVACYP